MRTVSSNVFKLYENKNYINYFLLYFFIFFFYFFLIKCLIIQICQQRRPRHHPLTRRIAFLARQLHIQDIIRTHSRRCLIIQIRQQRRPFQHLTLKWISQNCFLLTF